MHGEAGGLQGGAVAFHTLAGGGDAGGAGEHGDALVAERDQVLHETAGGGE